MTDADLFDVPEGSAAIAATGRDFDGVWLPVYSMMDASDQMPVAWLLREVDKRTGGTARMSRYFRRLPQRGERQTQRA